MNAIVCFQCSKTIANNSTIYKYCDATLCSLECSNYRRGVIDHYDPNFCNPESWKYIKNYYDLTQFRLCSTENNVSRPLVPSNPYCIINIMPIDKKNIQFNMKGIIIYITGSCVAISWIIFNNIMQAKIFRQL